MSQNTKLTSEQLAELDKEFDKIRAQIFIKTPNSVFASLMTQLEFQWDETINTASVDGSVLRWNPDWFKALTQNHKKIVLLHEIDHMARLHLIRENNRDHQLWNMACDSVINYGLKESGWDFTGLAHIHYPEFDGKSEEEIYAQLLQRNETPRGAWGSDPENIEGDFSTKKVDAPALIQKVKAAVKQSSEGFGLDKKKSETLDLLDKFTRSQLPWHTILEEFLQEMITRDASYRTPNRNYLHTGLYLPGKGNKEFLLESVTAYLDESGSIEDSDIVLFNSEAKHIFDQFTPETLKLVLFDTIIQSEIEIARDEQYDKIVASGRGGTNLTCVREHICKTKPTIAIIFTDLDCYPMQPLPKGVDTVVVWVVYRNPTTTPTFGKTIHMGNK